MLQNHTMTEHTHIPRSACFASVPQLTEFVKLMFLSFAGSAGEEARSAFCPTLLNNSQNFAQHLLNFFWSGLALPCFVLFSLPPSARLGRVYDPIGENCQSQKLYGIIPIWQFV